MTIIGSEGTATAPSEAKRLSLDQAITITESDLVDPAPVVRSRVGLGALSVSELCEAMLQVGDKLGETGFVADRVPADNRITHPRAVGDGRRAVVAW